MLSSSSAAAAAVSSAIMLFQRWQLHKALLLSFLSLHLLQVGGCCCNPLKPLQLPPPVPPLPLLLFLSHSLMDHLWSLQLWENPPVWESEVNTCEKRSEGNFRYVSNLYNMEFSFDQTKFLSSFKLFFFPLIKNIQKNGFLTKDLSSEGIVTY